MSNFSATFAPNRCVLANTGGTNIWVGCCKNDHKRRKAARKAIRERARETPGSGPASCTCPRHGKIASAANACSCGHCR